MRRVPILILLITLLNAKVVAAELGDLGRINFPTSASGAAQEHFLAGVAYLHSFGWQQARTEFLRAQELDSDFVLAYWGEALSYNHPLLPEQNPEAPLRSLEKLASTRSAREAMAVTGLEKGLLEAVEAYVSGGDDTFTRRNAHRLVMERLYGRYPEQEEIRAFYILSLLSEASSAGTDQRHQLRQLAGMLANRLFSDNPYHPGAAHYLIHAYDDPASASLALQAADRYAEIAPIVAHARHMPTHIYIHLGRWRQVAVLNETALYTARALWRPGDDPEDQLHAIDFGQYGDLQLADYESARQWIVRTEDTLTQNPDDRHVVELLGRLKARLIVESKQWQTSPVDQSSTNDELFAAGLSAVNMRDLALAREANRLLKERIDSDQSNIPLLIGQLELEASILFASDRMESSFEKIDEAAALAVANPQTDPLPDPLKPALELKGELLLRANLVNEAITTFHEALESHPYRPWSLLGLARSYATLGDNRQASVYYQLLLESWNDPRLLGVSEARTHLTLHGNDISN